MSGAVIVQWARRLLWGLSVCIVFVPFALAAASPLQAARESVYIAGALAGVLALSLLFVQPLLAAGFLPGISPSRERRWHRWLGGALLLTVALHVIGLYLASPDDMLDALLLVAPTPFSLYGVIALWAVVLIALSAILRSRARAHLAMWNRIHSLLAVIVVGSSLVHVWMIDGSMNSLSKTVTCISIALAALAATIYRQWIKPTSRRSIAGKA